MTDARAHHRFVPGRPHWWQWPTVLSLDAPLVAVAWQLALSRAARVTLQAHHAFLLGASVWLAYAADRWIEGWRLEPAQVRTQRHWFHQEWRRPVAVLWVLLLGLAVAVAVRTLSSRELDAGLLLLAPVALCLLSHQLLHRNHRWRAPKEICVAGLLAAGVMCFITARDTAAPVEVAAPLALFALLCFANCCLISAWEDEVDRTHGQTSLALQFPRGRAAVRALPWLIAGAAALAAVTSRPALSPACWCAAASGLLLGGLDLAHRQFGRQLSRALVDMTLMTPLVAGLVGIA